MDRWGLVIVFMALAVVLLGHELEGGSLGLLWNPAAALIVFGGSLLAALAQLPQRYLPQLMQLLSWLLAPPHFSYDSLVNKLTTCGHAQRRDGILALERLANAEPDPVLQKGLMLLADGYEREVLNQSIIQLLDNRQQRDSELVNVLDNLAGYLPTLGIVGAVLGLMQVLSNIQQAEALASGIATAFVATFYGVASANLIVIPLANRLRQQLAMQRRYYDIMQVGLLAIHDGVNPSALRFRLQGLVL